MTHTLLNANVSKMNMYRLFALSMEELKSLSNKRLNDSYILITNGPKIEIRNINKVSKAHSFTVDGYLLYIKDPTLKKFYESKNYLSDWIILNKKVYSTFLA